MIAMLCDSKGETLCGTDTYAYVDGRLSIPNKIAAVSAHVERFKWNFQWKYVHWTHCYFVNKVTDIPSVIYKLTREKANGLHHNNRS